MSTLGTDVLGSEVPLGTFADTTFSDSVTEAATAADTTSSALVSADTVAESGSATDAVSSALVAVGTVPESGTASDATNGTLANDTAINESATATDAEDAQLDAAATVAEAASAVDAQSAALVGADAVAESATAVDAASATLVRTGAVAEVATADDASSSVLSAVGRVAESAPAADHTTATGGTDVIAEFCDAQDGVSATVSGRLALRVIDPRFMDVEHWSRLVSAGLLAHGQVSRWATEENWPQWAQQVRQLPALGSLNIPDPRSYSDWQTWAFAFNSAVWMGANVVH